MTLTLEQWKEILDAVIPNKGDIFEQIKRKVEERDKGTYQSWKQKGFDIDHLFDVLELIFRDKSTLLDIAILSDRLEIVEALLDKGANVNVKGRNCTTPLHKAAFKGHLEMVKYLVKNGADINAEDKDGSTPLYNAIYKDHLEIVKYLIENGADINMPNGYGITPLHSVTNSLEIAKYLIENGANINVKDKDGNTPLCKLYNDIEEDYDDIEEDYEAVADLIVNHIAKLKTVDLHVTEENLEKVKMNNNYSQYLQNYKKEVQKIKERNEMLYEFLKESDVNRMADIWEQNENLRNKFDNEKSLKAKYPEYANILINKANEVKKEIFLHNHKSLIAVLSENYTEGFQKMSFTGIKNFFASHKNDYGYIQQETGVTLMNCLDFEDVKEKHIPKLKLITFAKRIKNKGAGNNINDSKASSKLKDIVINIIHDYCIMS